MKTSSFKEIRSWVWRPVIAIALSGVLATGAIAQQGTIRDVTDIREEGQEASRESQALIDALDDETAELLAQYRGLLDDLSTVTKYNQQLRIYIENQKIEEASLNRQIRDVTTISRDVVPLMRTMTEGYERFIAEDIPFLAQERANRSEILATLINQSNVAPGEKYRRILEAYQIENEYGRTIEAYKGVIDTEGTGNEREVDYLRVGRVGFFYQTLGQDESGYWDVNSKSWKILDSGYSFALRQGLRMARNEIPPDLLILPLLAPEDAR